MMNFSSRASIQESDTLRMNALAAAKRARGERVYNLSVGEPLVPLSAHIVEAADAAMRRGDTRYPPVPGIPALREAACVWMNTSYQTQYVSSECLVTAGGKFALFALFGALIEPDDEVLVIAPYWVSYPPMISFFGGVSKFVQTQYDQQWKVSVALLEAQRSEKTKMLVFNNASNPTGVLYSREEVREILAWANAHDIFVVSDEVYSGLVYDGVEYVSCGSFPEFKESVAIVQSASKNFGMTGLRVGFLFASEDIIRTCGAIQGQSTSGPSIVSQYAALAACEHAQEVSQYIFSEMQSRRDALVAAFATSHIPIPTPQSSLYAFVPLRSFGSTDLSSVDFCEKMLEERGVAMVPGSAFGAEGFVRLSFGGSVEDVQGGMLASLADR
jgi:aspartate/methionine/tyrosine aminotransferase